jgi:dTDP-4-amino-4,6-dideoxygalactose transaminase
MKQGQCFLKATDRKVAACVPMHTFGFPCRIDEIADICSEWHIALVEDAAEAAGSYYRGRHCGTFGMLGCFSFNGNKIVTTGGGGAIITNDAKLGALAKHLTTTAKVSHPWEYFHDAAGWNFRMPNLNAALGCAQLEQLETFIVKKRCRAARYAEVFSHTPWTFMLEPPHSRSNYWLCAVLFNDRNERDIFLQESNGSGFMTRPVWRPLNLLPMYAQCHCGDLSVAEDIAARLVNLPSGFGQ